MIQNKLVWFQTKRAYNDAIDHGDIDDHSIVFVGDGTIYTHGTEFSTKKVNQRIDDMIDQVDQDLGEYRDKVKDLADALKDSERERYAALITDAQNRLNEAQALLQQYKAKIADALQNETNQGHMEYEGQLYDYAEVLDIVSSTLTNLQRRMGLIGDDLDQFVGFLETGQTINELELSVLDYIREINMLTAQAKEKLDYINVNQAIRTVLLREMDAKNGIIHDYITTTWLEENLTHVVEAVMNSMEPSWHVLVSRVNANSTDVAQLRVISNEHESAITNLVTRSNTAADTIASLSVRVTDTEASIDSLAQVNTGLAESIAQVQQKADENSAQIALLSQYSGGGSDNTNIAGLITRVNALEAATALYALQQDLNGAISRIAALELHSDDSGSSFTLTAEAVDDVLNATHAAKIFGFANAQGSGITLSADVLNFESSTIRIPRANLDLGVIDGLSEEDREMLENFQEYLESLEDVDYISWADLRSNGITFANNNDDLISLNLTDGLIHRYGDDPQKSSFHLALDGSGHLGYDSEGNYAISWGPDGVLIPSQNTFPQGGGEGGDTRYYQQAFKVTNDDTQPSVPNANFPNGNDGWNKYALNTTGKYVWMTTRLVKLLEGNQITVLETWQTPWLISGPQGNPGEDGEGIEFVFHVSNSDDPSTAPALNGAYGTSAFQKSGYVPTGWTNHPTGVSELYKYEWGACRTKDSEGVWSQFFGPFLWSHYGENGTDGDGVEYIYYLDRNGSMIGVNDPTSWNIQYPEAFQADEYTGPTGSKWEDDPQNTQSGEYQYVSVRKKHNGTWGAFSSPTVWTYHAVDGVVDGFTVDLTNENMPVGTDAQGNVSNYTNSTAVEVFHNGARYTDFTVAVGTITRSDGASVTGMTATVSGSTITFSITSAANFAAKNAFIPITVTLGNGTTRSLTATAFGIATGEAGSSIDLKTDVSVIRTDYYGTTRVPSTVAPYVSISSGNGTITTIYPNQTSDYTFKYLHHKTSGTYTTETTLTTNTISTIADADYLEIRLYYGGTKIDTEKIPYVKDGAPGVRGHDATTYNVSILSSTITVAAPEASPRKVTGTVKFKITKTAVQQQNGEYTTVTEELTTKTPGTSGIWDSETFACSMNGKTNTSATYSNGEWSITLNENYANVPFGTIVVYSATNTPVASAGVPFVITGAKGEQGLQGDTQGLSGIVLRFNSAYSSTKTYRCGSLNQEDGIWYKDVVLYNGAYYHPNSADITGTAPADSNGNTNTGWTRFNMVDDAYINNLIVNNAYINSLTTDQIAITNSSGKVVAGMTSGSKIPTSITGTSSQVNNSSGIRIFAGTVPSNGNIANCAFTVKETGEVKASGGKVEFDVDGAGKVANGNISWTSSGQVTINGQVIQVGGSNVMTEGSFSNQLADGTALTNWINSKMITVDPEDIAAYLEENGLNLEGYAKTSDLTAYQLKSSLVSDLTQAGYNLATMSNTLSLINAWSNDGSWLYTTFAQKSELTNLATKTEAQSYVTTWATNNANKLWTEAQIGSKITNTVNNSYIESALKTTSIKNYLDGTYVTSSSLTSTLADYVLTDDLDTYATKTEALGYVTTWATNNANKLWTEALIGSKITSTVNNSYIESALKTTAIKSYLDGTYVTSSSLSSTLADYVETDDLDAYATKTQAQGYVTTWASNNSGKLHTAAEIGSLIDDKMTATYVKSKLQLTTVKDYLDSTYVTSATLGSYYTKTETNTQISSAISTQATTDEAKFTLKSEITGSGSNSIKSAIVGIVKAGKSSLELTADDITLSGNTTVKGKLQAIDALFDDLQVGELYALDPETNGRALTVNISGIAFTTPNGISVLIRRDGSGSLANGNISWDTEGNVTIKHLTIDSTTSTIGESCIIITGIVTEINGSRAYAKATRNRTDRWYPSYNAEIGGSLLTPASNYTYVYGVINDQYLYDTADSNGDYTIHTSTFNDGDIYNAIGLFSATYQVYRYGQYVEGGTLTFVPSFSSISSGTSASNWNKYDVQAFARLIKEKIISENRIEFASTDPIKLYDQREGATSVSNADAQYLNNITWGDIPAMPHPAQVQYSSFGDFSPVPDLIPASVLANFYAA